MAAPIALGLQMGEFDPQCAERAGATYARLITIISIISRI